MHYPVLLKEVVEYLAIRPEGVYLDCTLGAAGYAEAILSRLTTGRLIAVDWDETALEAARKKLARYGDQVTFHHGGYGEIVQAVGDARPAGAVADLGLSRNQIEDPERGFSFQYDGPLDMRFDRRRDLTAEQIVNYWDERDIASALFTLGGERRSRRIAGAIVRGRPVRSTRHLAELIERVVPRTHRDRIHPATRTFQALRIAVNDELGQLDRLLEAAPPLLEAGGRLVVVSFHSLEDGRVKHAFRRWERGGGYDVVTRRPARPSDEEIAENPASRGAKLRVLERKY